MPVNTVFRRKQLSAVIIALLTPGFAGAEQVNWTGTTGFWDVITNCSSNPALPASGGDAVLGVGGAQTITVLSNGGPFSVNSVNTTMAATKH